MSTNEIPEIAELSAEQLLALRGAIDTKLAEIRAAFIQQAATLDLTLVDGQPKKRKPRASAVKHHDAG